MMMYQEEDVIPYMANMWQDALQSICGLNSKYFNGKHQDCPHCGGKDRFRWTNKKDNKVGDGWAYCNNCGADKGIGWLMKLSGEPYSECINILGRFLGKVPQEYVIKQNKRAAKDPGYSFGATAEHDKCQAILDRTEKRSQTPLTMFEGLIGESFDVGVKALENGAESVFHVLPMQLVQGNELDDEYCNLLIIDEFGSEQFYARDYTRGAVIKVGSTDKAIYLVNSWFDAVRVHEATGQECWACIEPSNIEIVAYRYTGERELRVACPSGDLETLYMADDRELKVIIPNDDRSGFKSGCKRALYDPLVLINRKN